MESIYEKDNPEPKKPSFSVKTPPIRTAVVPQPERPPVQTKSITGRSSLAKMFVGLSWVLSIGGVGVGGLILVGGMSSAQSAPQEAVVVSLAIACAVLPYCFARAVTELADL